MILLLDVLITALYVLIISPLVSPIDIMYCLFETASYGLCMSFLKLQAGTHLRHLEDRRFQNPAA
jgi:hypothetical protein